MEEILRVLAILAVPVMWGLITARLLEWLRERRTARTDEDQG